MAQTLLGKEVTAALNERIKADVEKLKAAGVNPTLGIIRVGERGDDISYERGAMKRCDTLGVAVKQYLLPADVTQEQLIATIEEVNKDDSIHGVLMFRPLPKHLDEEAACPWLAYSPVSRRASRPARRRPVWRSWIITASTAPARKRLSSVAAW